MTLSGPPSHPNSGRHSSAQRGIGEQRSFLIICSQSCRRGLTRLIYAAGQRNPSRFGNWAVVPLYAAHLALGDHRRYVAALEAIGTTVRSSYDDFRKYSELYATIEAADAGIFPELIDLYLDDPDSVAFADRNRSLGRGYERGFGAQIRRMRSGLGLPNTTLIRP